MAPLARFDAVSVAFGDQDILANADFQIDAVERVCLRAQRRGHRWICRHRERLVVEKVEIGRRDDAVIAL